MAIKFSEKHMTGFNEIDLQHKELFKRIEALYEACINNRAREEIKITMSYLEKYVEEHFKTEETYMEQYIYSGTFMHKASHSQFKQIFLELKENFEKNGIKTDFIIKVNKTLINWLISHMGNEDKKLADFLKKKIYKT